MAFRYLLLGVVVALAAASGFSIAEAPAGWFLAGSNPDDYLVGVVDAGPFGQSAYLKSQVPDPDGFGTLMQSFDVAAFRGKRIRMSAQVKSVAVYGRAGLWMRVDGDGETLLLDNMTDRLIRGDWDWTRHELVLDLPPESELVAFGIFLHGRGEVLLDNVDFEEVGPETPITGLAKHVRYESSGRARPSAPSNLDFEVE